MDVREIREDVKEIKSDIKDIKQSLIDVQLIQAKNTVVLDDHKLRSDRSETRIELLESEYTKLRGFFFYMGLILGAAGTISGLVIAIQHLLTSK